MKARQTKASIRTNSLLRTMFAGLLSLAMLLSCFHGSACETDIRSALPGTAVAEQSQPAPHSPAQHQLADHCLSHLVGDLNHPAAAVTISVAKVKLAWRDEANRPLASADSPFKPPRA